MFDDELQSRPSASLHPRGRVSRTPSKKDRLGSRPTRRACSRAPDAPRSGCVGHSVSRNPPSRPSLLSKTTSSACVGGNDLCTQSEFHGQQLRFGQRMPRHSPTMRFTSRHCERELPTATYPPGVAAASMARQRISVTASIVFCAAAAGHAIAWNAFCRGAARRGGLPAGPNRAQERHFTCGVG